MSRTINDQSGCPVFMFRIDFKFEGQPMESLSFKSHDNACDFWCWLLDRDDIEYADRTSWDLDIPFPEVEHE